MVSTADRHSVHFPYRAHSFFLLQHTHTHGYLPKSFHMMLTSADGELTLIKTNNNFAVESQAFQVRVLNPLLILSLQISAPFGVSKCHVKLKKKLHKLIYNMK